MTFLEIYHIQANDRPTQCEGFAAHLAIVRFSFSKQWGGVCASFGNRIQEVARVARIRYPPFPPVVLFGLRGMPPLLFIGNSSELTPSQEKFVSV